MINIRRNKNNNKNYSNKMFNSSQNVSIMDTTANQCLFGEPAWRVLNETGEK